MRAADLQKPPVLPSLAVVLQGFDQPGAVATSCLNQIAILVPHYRITVFTEAGSPQLRPAPAGVVVRRLPIPELLWLRRFAHVPRQWVFLRCVKRALLSALECDGFVAVIVHSHPAAALLAAPLRRRGVRSIMVVHGDIFERPKGTYDWCLTAWYRWATPRAYRRVSAILSLSPAMEKLARRWTAGLVPIHWVPNSIDPDAIGLQSGLLRCDADDVGSGDADREPMEILYVGRIEPHKGIDVLLRALARLLEQGRSLRLRCLGSVSPAYRTRLQRQIAELGLDTHVLLNGPQPRNQLGDAYRCCTLLVVPSRSEPQATVILEGMAAGCAIVASDVGGNAMMLQAERSGLLFPCDDLKALVGCLERLLDDPSLRQQLGREARLRFEEAFSRQAVAPRLCEAVAATLA